MSNEKKIEFLREKLLPALYRVNSNLEGINKFSMHYEKIGKQYAESINVLVDLLARDMLNDDFRTTVFVNRRTVCEVFPVDNFHIHCEELSINRHVLENVIRQFIDGDK